MTEERKFASESITPTEESLTLPSNTRTWGNDSITKKGWSWSSISNRKWRLKWNRVSKSRQTSAARTANLSITHKLSTVFSNAHDKTRPILGRFGITKKQIFAFFLLVACAITPFAVFGHLTRGWSYRLNRGNIPFITVWYDKTLSCGGDFSGKPQNSTITGIEKLFVLDQTYGRFSFSQVKTIDAVWDIFVGRGVQLCAWWVAYVVFCDALLRVIERHPASFRIFQRIASEGPSLLSVWTLVKEVWAAKSRRTRALFFYIFLSTIYVLWIPILLSAMTGYDSSTISWVSLDDDNNKIVPSSSLKISWVIYGTKNETFEPTVCRSLGEQSKISELQYDQARYCDCRFPNGTMVEANPNSDYSYRLHQNCTTKYPGNMQTYTLPSYRAMNGIGYCNSTYDMTINGKSYDGSTLNGTYGYCYNSVGYSGWSLYDKSRCLPDTANPSYQWGFSTILSALFIIFHFTWCITMYMVWQDAQFNSSLVKNGYAMTPVLAAFAMAKAAKCKTGLDEKQLLRANTKELHQELYGSRKTKGTKVEYSFFVHDAEQDASENEGLVRRRRVQPSSEPGSSGSTLD